MFREGTKEPHAFRFGSMSGALCHEIIYKETLSNEKTNYSIFIIYRNSRLR